MRNVKRITATSFVFLRPCLTKEMIVLSSKGS